MLWNGADQWAGIPALPTTAPAMLPAVAAVQSLSRPMATVSEITRVKSVPPMVSPQMVRQALFSVCTPLMPAKCSSTGVTGTGGEGGTLFHSTVNSGNTTGTARGLKRAGATGTQIVSASVDLSGLHMASDSDFNRKSFTTGHTGFGVPFATWPDRADVPRNAARPLRYMDRYLTVTQGEVFYVTEAMCKLEGLERGPSGNTAMTAALSLARDLPRDATVVVQETEYTGAGKHHWAQLNFAREQGVEVRAGDPRELGVRVSRVWLEPQDGLCVDLAAQNRRQMGKYSGDPSPCPRGYVIVVEVSDYGSDLDPACLGETMCFGHPDFRLVNGRYMIPSECQMNRVAAFAFSQTKHWSLRNVRCDLRQETIRGLAIDVTLRTKAVVPKSGVHGGRAMSRLRARLSPLLTI